MILYESKRDCCGCGACKNICPKGAVTMSADSEGFLYPVIDSSLCVECGLCQKVCPLKAPMPQGEAAPRAFGAKHREDAVRAESSSGGLFTALSQPFLREGAVYGAALTDVRTVSHIRAENEAGRNACRGSKYCQSDTGDTFARVKADLLAGKQVLYTGSACQIAGLLAFLQGCDTRNLTTVDFVCHGVPSPMLYRQYIDFLEAKKGAVKSYAFRPKDKGWGHSEKAVFESGAVECGTLRTSVWKNIFYSNLALRPACYSCRYASLHRPADVTIADFWGAGGKYPEFSDAKGVSFVLANSPKGLALLDGVRHTLELIPCAPTDSRNPNLHHPTPCPAGREQFWQVYAAGGFDALASRWGQYSVKGLCKRIVKKLIGRA